MKWLTAIVAALALGLPGSAHACLGKHLERYIVLQDPPARLPDGAVLIRVRLLGNPDDDLKMFTEGPAVRILAGPGAGRVVSLKLRGWSSCSRWLETERSGYIVGWIDGPRHQSGSIEPLEYRARVYREPDEENSVGYKRTELK